MLAITKSATMKGIEGIEVDVEVNSVNGLPAFKLIGLGDRAVTEAGERVRGAIKNCSMWYPKGRITVNLSPAWIHKKGSHFDLAIAVGILTIGNYFSNKILEEKGFMGELALDGKILPVSGILPMIRGLLGKVEELYLPSENCMEAFLATEGTKIKIFPATSLRSVVEHLSGKKRISEFTGRLETGSYNLEKNPLDFDEVKGHWAAKEAITVAVSGGHSLLMVGAPGTGKTMLAKRIATVLPPMTAEERLETTGIYSLAGALNENQPVIIDRPFRTVNKRTTGVTLLGGGREPLPGEISMANSGILFMDEFLEFSREQIELLRKPMEEKRIKIVRRGQIYDFPANFTLIGATNPCPCGYFGDTQKQCKCSANDISRYRNRLSGPIIERIDMSVEIPRVNYESLINNQSYSSEEMRERIQVAREIQEKRFYNTSSKTNGEMNETQISRFCKLERGAGKFLREAYRKYKMSPRRYHKILRLARTVADLEESEQIQVYHLAAALNYTRFFSDLEGGR